MSQLCSLIQTVELNTLREKENNVRDCANVCSVFVSGLFTLSPLEECNHSYQFSPITAPPHTHHLSVMDSFHSFFQMSSRSYAILWYLSYPVLYLSRPFQFKLKQSCCQWLHYCLNSAIFCAYIKCFMISRANQIMEQIKYCKISKYSRVKMELSRYVFIQDSVRLPKH